MDQYQFNQGDSQEQSNPWRNRYLNSHQEWLSSSITSDVTFLDLPAGYPPSIIDHGNPPSVSSSRSETNWREESQNSSSSNQGEINRIGNELSGLNLTQLKERQKNNRDPLSSQLIAQRIELLTNNCQDIIQKWDLASLYENKTNLENQVLDKDIEQINLIDKEIQIREQNAKKRFAAWFEKCSSSLADLIRLKELAFNARQDRRSLNAINRYSGLSVQEEETVVFLEVVEEQYNKAILKEAKALSKKRALSPDYLSQSRDDRMRPPAKHHQQESSGERLKICEDLMNKSIPELVELRTTVEPESDNYLKTISMLMSYYLKNREKQPQYNQDETNPNQSPSSADSGIAPEDYRDVIDFTIKAKIRENLVREGISLDDLELLKNCIEKNNTEIIEKIQKNLGCAFQKIRQPFILAINEVINSNKI